MRGYGGKVQAAVIEVLMFSFFSEDAAAIEHLLLKRCHIPSDSLKESHDEGHTKILFNKSGNRTCLCIHTFISPTWQPFLLRRCSESP